MDHNAPTFLSTSIQKFSQTPVTVPCFSAWLHGALKIGLPGKVRSGVVSSCHKIAVEWFHPPTKTEMSSIYKLLLFVLLAVCLVLVAMLNMVKFLNLMPVPAKNINYWSFEYSQREPQITEIKFDLGDGEILELWDFKPMLEYNNMRIGYNNNCTRNPHHHDKKPNNGIRPTNQFIVVTNFRYLNPKDPKNQKLLSGGLKLTEATIHGRNMEVINALASNLNHRYIEEVHILVEHSETAEYLRHLPLHNSHKAVVQIMQVSIEMKTQLQYAGRCLLDRIIAVSHQDNRYGGGWEKFQPDFLRKGRLMYALTRHTSSLTPCQGSKRSANCDPGYPYIGSHDVFMFHVKDNFTTETLKQINKVTPNLYGMENLLIHVFRTKFSYMVTNPCPILKVHHEHCIALREPGRIRVYSGGSAGKAKFTNQLSKAIPFSNSLIQLKFLLVFALLISY